MRVLGFGTYDADRHPRVAIILDGLRRHGDDVLEANAPLGLDTAQRIAMVRRPWLAYRLVLRLGRCWWQLARCVLRLRRGTRIDAVVVGYLGQFDVLLARALFPRGLIVLDLLVFGADTADDRGLGRAGGPRRRLLGWLDRAAAATADIVVVDTMENRSLLAVRQRPKAVVVAVGAPASWLAAGAARARVSGAGSALSSGSAGSVTAPMRVVFFGLFTPLQGIEVIATALAQLGDRADIAVTMVGTGQLYERARRLAAGNTHVRWRDWIASADLPEFVAGHDVCLGIFGTGSKGRRVVPNKVFQGAAAGCAIITSDTAPQRRTLGPAAAILVAPGDPDALAQALRNLADDRTLLARLATSARELALRSFTPEQVVEPLREQLLARTARPGALT
jgi:glycosyltransferase involved in cell wall biosynthesis